MEAKILYINDYKRRKGIMSIKLNYSQINSADVNQTLMMLASQNGFSTMQASYNVARIKRQFDKEMKVARELYNNFVKDFTVKDEQGNPKPATVPHPYCPFELIEEKRAEFDKKVEDFLKVEVELQSHMIQPSDLGTIKLSPQQMLVLEPFINLDAFEPASPTP